MAAQKPTAVVVVFPGSNCDRDLLETFDATGFDARFHPHNEPLPKVDVVGLPGGFSYGDYWRAGMLASQAKAVQGLRAHAEQGGLVIGICNGFQILVEQGLLPGAVTYNQPAGFQHRWVTVEVPKPEVSPWFSTLTPDKTLHLPIAHGEGNYFHPDGPSGAESVLGLRYQTNPNGSMASAAGIVDPTGRIFGLMPHPERASDPHLGSTDGVHFFEGARRHVLENR